MVFLIQIRLMPLWHHWGFFLWSNIEFRILCITNTPHSVYGFSLFSLYPPQLLYISTRYIYPIIDFPGRKSYFINNYKRECKRNVRELYIHQIDDVIGDDVCILPFADSAAGEFRAGSLLPVGILSKRYSGLNFMPDFM